MHERDNLLRLAIDDNIAWCSAVCAAHGAHEINSMATWANLSASPRLYPNIVTREADAQCEVEKLISKVAILNKSKQWAIKDSFNDLNLRHLGFEKVLSASWYGGIFKAEVVPSDWAIVDSPDQLHLWEKAWGGGGEARSFPDSLLLDHRISFWLKGNAAAIEGGFISFDRGPSVGISNWFSLNGHSLGQMGALQAISPTAGQRPIVCWSSDELPQEAGLSRLGALQVWVRMRVLK